MDELLIPFVLWFSDEARPDLTTMAAPLMIAVILHHESGATAQDAENAREGQAVSGSEGADA